MRAIVAATCVLAMQAGVALADMPPRPGQVEREFTTLIRDAGYPCEGITLQQLTEAERKRFDGLAEQGYYLAGATCSNGKRYVVATPPRARPRPPRPDDPPRPLPKRPQVRPM
jgi:hypothetical protein